MVELLQAVVPLVSWLETWLWCLSSRWHAAAHCTWHGILLDFWLPCTARVIINRLHYTWRKCAIHIFDYAGLFELQAVKIAILTGAIKTIFSFILPLKLNLFHLIWH